MIPTKLWKRIARRRPLVVESAKTPNQRWSMDCVTVRKEGGRSSQLAMHSTNVAVECSRCFEALPPEEMVLANTQEGRSSYCEHMWQKTQAE